MAPPPIPLILQHLPHVANASPNSIAALTAPTSGPAHASTMLRKVTGERVVLQVDIADPPAPPRALCGVFWASDATPDAAVKALGAMIAHEISVALPELAAAAATAAPELPEPPAPPVVLP